MGRHRGEGDAGRVRVSIKAKPNTCSKAIPLPISRNWPLMAAFQSQAEMVTSWTS